MTDWTQRNPKPEAEGMLDSHAPAGGDLEGGRERAQRTTVQRAERVQFDIALSQGFSEPFAHIVCWTDEDGVRNWSIWSWSYNELIAEFAIAPDGEFFELEDVLSSCLS